MKTRIVLIAVLAVGIAGAWVFSSGLLGRGIGRSPASTDVPIGMKALRIDTRREPAKHKLVLTASLPATVDPGAEAVGAGLDPINNGASLLLLYKGHDYHRTELIRLDARKWRAKRNGWAYADRAATRGGVRSVLLKPSTRGGLLKIQAVGNNFPWEVPAGVNQVEIEFKIGDTRFCAEVSAVEMRLAPAGLILAKKVSAPGSCEIRTCGNGETEPGETCDDGNLDDLDACPNDCFEAPTGTLVSRSLATSWKGGADTDLQFSEFTGGDHTVFARFMPQYFRPDWAPVLGDSGQGTFALGQRSKYSGIWANVAKDKNWDAPLEPGKWYSLALVAERGSTQTDFTVYLDGEALSPGFSVNNSSSMWPQGTLRMGRMTDGSLTGGRPNAQFYGLIDDVAVFSRALSSAEIEALAEKSHKFDGSEVDLVAAYTFDQGEVATRLTRPVSTVGAAEYVPTSSSHNDADSNAFILPNPNDQETLLLPFKPGEAWTVTQGYAGLLLPGPSHLGIYDGCMDFIRATGASLYAPVFAAASGTVESGNFQTRYILAAPGDFQKNDYMHIETATPPDNDWPSVGKWFLRGDQIGKLTDYSNGAHLHFCNRDIDNVNGNPNKFFAAAFSDYEIKQKNGSWKFVKRGIPGAPGPNDETGSHGGQIIRRPLPANLPEWMTAIWRPGTEPEKQIYGATYDSYRSTYDDIWPDGWRLKDLEIAIRNNVPRYTAVWGKSTAPEKQWYDIGASALLGKYLSMQSQGWRLHILAPYVLNGQVLYTAVFRKSSATETASPFFGYDFANYQAKYDELWPQGYRLHILEVFVLDGQPRYMAVWRKGRGNPGEVQYYDLDLDALLAKYDELWPNNWRLEMIEAYRSSGTTRYAAIWRAGSESEYQIFDVSYRDYRTFYDNIWPDGWRLYAIDVR